MEGIAVEAGVGVATVYRHFGDKDRLVKSFIERLLPRATVFGVLQHPSDDVQSDLLAVTRMLLPFLYENRDLLRLGLSGGRAEQAYMERLRTGSERALDYLTEYCRFQMEAGRMLSRGKPHEMALTFIGMISSFALLGPVHYGLGLLDAERIAHLLVSTFLHGVDMSTEEAS
ncbi:MAG: hypothetical protein NVS4B8_07260 [Herpetosiphon sp.]